MLRYPNALLSIVAALAIITGSLSHIAAAQDAATAPASPSAPTAAPDLRPAFQSSGFRASINNVSINGRNVTIQLALQNTSKNRQYFLIFGSNKAATDSGLLGSIGEISGTDRCVYNSDSPDSFNLHWCMDGTGKAVENYSYIEPNDLTAISIVYNYPDDVKGIKNISFSLKMIARSASGDVDSLPDPNSQKVISPSRIVNINFPLIPLKSE